MDDEYEEAVDDGLNTCQALVAAYLAGMITLALLRSRFREALRLHYTRLMILALQGEEPTEGQLAELDRRISVEHVLLEGFLADLAVGEITKNRALWRAGMYAPARGLFSYFSVPQAIADLMPGLPGDVCLGNGLCGCWLEYEIDSDGTAWVWWRVNPAKEHCEVCLEYEMNNPYIFFAEELASASPD